MPRTERTFPIADFIRPSAGAPVRSVVLETAEAVIIVWHVGPRQEIPDHIHPRGQDTWTVLSGCADYRQGGGVSTRLEAGDIAVAKSGQIHGAINHDNTEPFVFVSVVSPGDAGHALA